MADPRDYQDALDAAYEIGHSLGLDNPTDDDICNEVCSALIIDRDRLTTDQWAAVVEEYDVGNDDYFKGDWTI